VTVVVPPTPSIPFEVTRATRLSRVSLAVWAVVLIILVLTPYLLGVNTAQKLTQLLILIVMATMWNFLAGYAGMVSVGQQAFIGIGAYVLVYTVNELGLDPILAILVAVVAAAAISYPLSFLLFRLDGGYFAIGTWVVAEVVYLVTSRVDALGGGVGMTLSGLPPMTPGVRIAYTYWIALGLTVLTLAITYRLLRSRLGAGFTAIRDDQIAASSIGVRVSRSKRIVYVAAAGGCAVAGGLLALTTLQVKPDAIYSVDFAAAMIFMAIIGGIGTIEGPIVGAVLYFLLQQWLSSMGAWYLVILGTVAITIAIVLPRGLWGTVADRWGIEFFPVGYRLHLPAVAEPDGSRKDRPGDRDA
jgi:branched-chain amino acid transport system permease protein